MVRRAVRKTNLVPSRQRPPAAMGNASAMAPSVIAFSFPALGWHDSRAGGQ